MEKYELKQKAYGIDFSRIEEGFLCSEEYVHAESRNKAKSLLLDKIGYQCLATTYGEEITYLNIPVVRAPEYDLYLFEGAEKTKQNIEEILEQRKRTASLDKILLNPEIKYCYIKKRGSYYCPHSCGYTQFKHKAGVYTKEEAIYEAKSCYELDIIPIDIAEHNKMIRNEINDLSTRLLSE